LILLWVVLIKALFFNNTTKMDYLKPLKIADIKIDPNSYTVKQQKKLIYLRKKEFELLYFFARNKNKVINRTTLLEKVWGTTCNPFTNTVDVHIAALRKKINTKNKNHLRTIHGVGYKFEI
jgi:two-component system alkaline phosphatase synthesis response regulator PhoP